MARLGALAQLDLDHFDLGVGGIVFELLCIKCAIACARAEIPAAQLPDQIAAGAGVIAADAALTCIMRKAAHFRACIQRFNRSGRQRAKAHRRDIEQRSVIGLLAGRLSHAFMPLVRHISIGVD